MQFFLVHFLLFRIKPEPSPVNQMDKKKSKLGTSLSLLFGGEAPKSFEQQHGGEPNICE